MAGHDDEAELRPTGYGELFDNVTAEVRAARIRAARDVNIELIDLYWRIGRLLLDERRERGWDSRPGSLPLVVPQLAIDLSTEFPGVRGLTWGDLDEMQTFASMWPGPIAQQPVARLPWGHITALLGHFDDQGVREWYAAQDARHGWSLLELQRRYRDVADDPVEVPPEAESDQVREILRDPHNLDFLALDPNHSERDLKDALVDRLTYSLPYLGTGFALVGRQRRLHWGPERLVFLDLLFYHLGLRRFVVFELKSRAAGPENVHRLNSYVGMVDSRFRRPEHGDGDTIGILLAASRDDVVVEYVQRHVTEPLADSAFTPYQELPDDVRAALPTPGDLAQVVRSAHTSADRKRQA